MTPRPGAKAPGCVLLEGVRQPSGAYGSSIVRRRGSRSVRVYTDIYTEVMAHRAKLFRNGGSQAVRLPKDCRFPDELREVTVRRDGRRVVLEALDAWPSSFLSCVGAWQDEISRPRQESVSKLRDRFK